MPQVDATNIAIAIVTVVGAVSTGTVLVIKAIGEMRVNLANIAHSVDKVHELVNSGATSLKEQNERMVLDAMKVAALQSMQAYQKGLAEGQLRAMLGAAGAAAPPEV
jgi:hypothetical protein